MLNLLKSQPSQPPPTPTLGQIGDRAATDSFTDCRPSGKVIGTLSPGGVRRLGADVEKRIGIDNGALRLQPLITPGWGKQGIAYGPYPRRNGLTFVAFVLNGHNTSESSLLETLRQRLRRWWLGSEAENPHKRLWRWLTSSHKRGMFRRLLTWIRSTPRFSKYVPLPRIEENFAIGWFPSAIPGNPPMEGNAAIVRATGADNGELLVRVGDRCAPLFQGLQNLQIYYAIVLRERGAAYYAASLPQARGLGSYPEMRPLAIDPFDRTPNLYAAIYQSVLGQIGFRVDTRVYGVQVQSVPEFEQWYGSARGADRLVGEGELDGSPAEIGGDWSVCTGACQRTPTGTIAVAADSLALLDPQVPCGLLHTEIATGARPGTSALVWRARDRENFWALWLSGDRWEVGIREGGLWHPVARSDRPVLTSNTVHSVQILDDGDRFQALLDGQPLFDGDLGDRRGSDATGIGIGFLDPHGNQFRALEAHPRSVAIPASQDLGAPWMATGSELILADEFEGEPLELSQTQTAIGGQSWRLEMGRGAIERTGNGSARVRATAQQPNCDRTAYTLPWAFPELADVQVEITPPGSDRGQGENGRAGLIFWQDADNYIIVSTWLEDGYGGASISSFFHLDGFEELYDAVWTNVGKRVYWGIPYTLRVVFDGNNYLTFVNEEPVLYRALSDVYPRISRLSIHRVGIVANWEWGNDTGSYFKHFTAKANTHGVNGGQR
ncbi:nucleotide-binding protein [Oxynema aestuarii]|uniref:nucleotide-binding protein n=1 Tax=Oxynema aestuarii TaxID=2874213 RepID=UPI001FE8331F|nr:nucleotide-binding protein [Oxynema aestuarii]